MLHASTNNDLTMNPVEDYIEKQPPNLRGLWHHLRWFILSKDDQIDEAIKYNVPFFMLNKKNWIYLNPVKGGGIDVSFLNGTKLISARNLLRIDGRKLVGSYRVETLESFNHSELDYLISSSMSEHQLAV